MCTPVIKNEYTIHFIIKVGYKGVYITQTCNADVGDGSGTFRAKTSSSRDGSRKNYFSNGTFPPGTVRAFFQKLISRFY